MAKIVVTPEDLGNGLEVQEQKVVVKVDGTSVKINAQGQLYTEHTVDVKASNIRVDEATQEIVIEQTDGSELRTNVANFFPQASEKVTAAEMNADGLKLTLANQEEVTLPKTQILQHLRGEEVLSLGGVTLGYLLPA